MHNLVLLIVCFLAGVLLRHAGRLPGTTSQVLNGVIIHVSLPAVTLLHVHNLRLSGDVLVMAAMPWLHFGLAALFFLFLGRVLRLRRSVVGALLLTGGLGNTSFVGLPMIEAFYGSEALVHGIIVDQAGSFMVLSTLGITVAGMYAGERPGVGTIARRIVTFPPFLALAAALVLIPVEYPGWLTVLLARLADTLAPLALLSVGFQLHAGHVGGNLRNLAAGLGFKLVLAPIFFLFLYGGVLGLRGLSVEVTLFEAAMPPMVTAGIIAQEHDIEPRLASLMVAVGIVLSFVSLPAWAFVFDRFF
ncbi:AEC family transporter [Prosthecochloris sp. N3]|uniref:AEC family transporter n=1 Tax=Prosthecochloris ethylica TaxID=2743976 RepID=A0ABR9XQB9_9CHLB|nr:MULTISPECIES: AEC family transporter [Prosthecochloris]MEC9485939.1 AEC family transporter [Prosthecochloris sp.]MBF0586561.1 AEC family transporter [Prosthecochloris ethylica]MBF0636174.1 AEC family transporter [Prosthecochloris ethylica]NUK47691.1 AEC family transporter [Prosthecochloris ethylica]RNA64357.1 AEC family transporter [Prosthecochloris sp. ZM_2]